MKYRLSLALFLALAGAGCATQPTAPEPADRFGLARQAYLQQDFERAFALMRAEAELGNPRAQYALGYMYYQGQGVPIDVQQALKWIRKAADQGDPKAIEALTRLASAAPAAAPQTPQK